MNEEDVMEVDDQNWEVNEKIIETDEEAEDEMRQILDEAIASRIRMVYTDNAEASKEMEVQEMKSSENYEETGIKLFSNSTRRIFGSESEEQEEGPAMKRRKQECAHSINDERAKIQDMVVDSGFIQGFK
ncbi:unnamed protein product [Thelazia callipaeda]|uniref:Uncharacterized protein n=1 Tax=Thelazia callipaeda TaxID=103827 RepID=A0A0N5CVZ2_THECL|nr:unnamed protein product [Thelazia callipaeda]